MASEAERDREKDRRCYGGEGIEMLDDILELLEDIAKDEESSDEVKDIGKIRAKGMKGEMERRMRERVYRLDADIDKEILDTDQGEEGSDAGIEASAGLDAEELMLELGSEEKSLREIQELEEELFDGIPEEDRIGEQRKGLEVEFKSGERGTPFDSESEIEIIDEVGEPDLDDVLLGLESEEELIDRVKDPEVETKKCPECGTDLEINTDRCPICGARF